MQKIKLVLPLLLLSMLIVGSSTSVSADIDGETEGDNTTITTDSLVVEIKGGGNVPFFFYWNPADDTVKYKLQIDSLFEVVDNATSADGVYVRGEDRLVPNSGIPSLAPLTWDFSDIVEENDGNDVTTNLDFNMTSTGDDLVIQFRIHLSLDESAQLKFDVIIDGYTFKDDEAMLVLGFKLINQGEPDNPAQNGQTINFGDGFFHSEDTAQDDNGDINVGLSTGSSDDIGNASPKIFLAYEHFDGKMVHDPTIGVSDRGNTIESDKKSVTINTNIPDSILPDLSKESLVVPTVISTLALLLIPSIIYFRKRNS